MDRIAQRYHPWLEKVEMSAGGRPRLGSDEVELTMVQSTKFYEDAAEKRFENGTVFITSQRCIYIPPNSKVGVSIKIEHLTGVTGYVAWWGSNKIHFHLRDFASDKNIGEKTNDGEVSVDVAMGLKARIMMPQLSIGIQNKKLFDKAFSDVKQAFEETMKAFKERHLEAIKLKKQDEEGVRLTHVGIGGLLRQKKETNEQIETALNEAFTDMDSLMTQAQTVTKLMDRLLARAVDLELGKEGKEKDAQDVEVEKMLQSLGMASPVTKLSAGKQYHEQLSRQLVDFLTDVMGAMKTISLTDAFCLYNKARGSTDLVSPEDILHACEFWESLKLPFRLKKFPSGSLVIQSASHDDAAVDRQIVSFIRSKNSRGVDSEGCDRWGGRGVSAVEVANTLNLSVQMGKELLQRLVLCGEVVEDEGDHAVLYYVNFFL